ncbi:MULTISPECIES: hypothetical protein [unclassified Pseudoclavibacter]|uniref:hypothetical protein n=1 Tax=unclassified Pseudoclavibacter TaxID=2615177 RepID=UPI001BA7901B|nr:hypothetical protein [Pseudoclavibacter sp. Marseille-Q4354]MBS3177754.1 hypothetical protein [Pseudoclavibacter sp. Marseille-Q4354]
MAARKPTAAQKREEELEVKALIAGAPTLLPASQFRQRHKSQLKIHALSLKEYVNEDGVVNEDDPKMLSAFFTLLGEVDEFFESIAADKTAYIEWSQGLKDSEMVFSALLSEYMRELGE